jgi:uncharacterized membrane protein
VVTLKGAVARDGSDPPTVSGDRVLPENTTRETHLLGSVRASLEEILNLAFIFFLVAGQAYIVTSPYYRVVAYTLSTARERNKINVLTVWSMPG